LIGINEQLIQRATHRIRLGTSVQLSGARTPRRDQRARIQSNKPFADGVPDGRLAQPKRTQLPRTPPQQTGGNTSHSTRQQKRRQRPVPHRHAAGDEPIVGGPTRYPDHRCTIPRQIPIGRARSCARARVAGVAFFDFDHGKTGARRTGELLQEMFGGSSYRQG